MEDTGNVKKTLALKILCGLCLGIAMFLVFFFFPEKEGGRKEQTSGPEAVSEANTAEETVEKITEETMEECGDGETETISEVLEPWIRDAESLIENQTTATDLEPLKNRILELIDIPGETWSVYVKNLSTNQEIRILDEPLYSASLCKLFAMEYWVRQMTAGEYDYESDLFPTEQDLRNRIADMIEVSDNDAFNELVQEMSEEHSFEQGCGILNTYLEQEGYHNSRIFHTLHPSYYPYLSASDEENRTSAAECGALLEKVYRGEKSGDAAAAFMLDLLLQQEATYKIPTGLPKGTQVANKTGETDTREHDAAIVYGPQTDFILCVMNGDVHEVGDAMEVIRRIAGATYFTFNPDVKAPEGFPYYEVLK